MINMHISQHARTVQCKHRDGNPKKEPKNLTKMKNAFDGLISILDMAQERISELEDTSIKSSKTESKENTV